MDTNTVNSKGWYADSLAWLESFSAGVKNKASQSLEQAKEAVDGFSMVPASPSLFLLGIAGCGGGKGEDSGEVEGGYCLVTTESDSSTDGGSLRHKIESTYNDGGALANCTPPASDPGDADYFDQVVLFDTAEMCADGAECTDNVETITLDRQLTFDNSSQDIVIGNWSPDVVTDDGAVVDYDQDYIDALVAAGEYGNVTIDAQTDFDADEAPFICGSGTQEAYLRNVAILTNGLTESELFGAASCLRNAGAVYVCGSEVDESIQPDESGWCLSE